MSKPSLLGAGTALLCAALLVSPAVARGLTGGHLSGGGPVHPPRVSHPPSPIKGPRYWGHSSCRGPNCLFIPPRNPWGPGGAATKVFTGCYRFC